MCLGSGLLIHFGNHTHFGPFRFMLSFFLMYAVGYPIGHTAVIGIFSKIVSNRPQVSPYAPITSLIACVICVPSTSSPHPLHYPAPSVLLFFKRENYWDTLRPQVPWLECFSRLYRDTCHNILALAWCLVDSLLFFSARYSWS